MSASERLRKRGWSVEEDEQDKEKPPVHQRRRLESNASSMATSDNSSMIMSDDDDNADPMSNYIGDSKNSTQQLKMSTTNASSSSRTLSKWAARLLDPDRPRGVMPPPKTIPLNDEFLQAFGKREKKHDQTMGVTLEIDHSIPDEEGDKIIDLTQESNAEEMQPNTPKDPKKSIRKVKISNLKYTTTEETLQSACAWYGAVESIHLVMDDTNPDRNKGRAYVTFERPGAADACRVGLTKLDGRKVTVVWANEANSSSGNRRTERYYNNTIIDISTKCFRCGQVGHREADCDQEAVQKPCPLCASRQHDLRSCPGRAVCFNCGVPGHVIKECPRPRGMAPRQVCTLCLQFDHVLWQCRGHRNRLSLQHVVCMTCGKRGHYMCQNMKWFRGLDGVSCFNCGQAGHIGVRCDRPNAETCARSEDVTRQEVARALALPSDTQRRPAARQSPHQRRGGGDRSSNNRARSLPPQNRKRNRWGPRR